MRRLAMFTALKILEAMGVLTICWGLPMLGYWGTIFIYPYDIRNFVPPFGNVMDAVLLGILGGLYVIIAVFGLSMVYLLLRANWRVAGRLVFLLLLLPAVAGARTAMTECLEQRRGEPDAQRICEEIIRPEIGGPYSIQPYRIHDEWMYYGDDFPRYAPVRYEYKIIPESELQEYLNNGWEFASVYTVQVWGKHFDASDGVSKYVVGPYPKNKAIVKRRVK